jgi:hypothetical protein
MVVQIENTDLWVTPGLYQKDQLSIKAGIDEMASIYGNEIETLELKGVFILN